MKTQLLADLQQPLLPLTLSITEVNARIKDPGAVTSSSDKDNHTRAYRHQQSTDAFVRIKGNRHHKQIQNQH